MSALLLLLFLPYTTPSSFLSFSTAFLSTKATSISTHQAVDLVTSGEGDDGSAALAFETFLAMAGMFVRVRNVRAEDFYVPEALTMVVVLDTGTEVMEMLRLVQS